MSDTVLRLPPALRERIERLAQSGYPEEVCGLLVGRRVDVEVRVHEVVATHNAERRRRVDRYTIDPEAWLHADLRARARGDDIVGVWHSHPDAPAAPSAIDRAGAWAGWSYLIVAVTGAGAGELRSWRVHDGQLREETIRT